MHCHHRHHQRGPATKEERYDFIHSYDTAAAACSPALPSGHRAARWLRGLLALTRALPPLAAQELERGGGGREDSAY